MPQVKSEIANTEEEFYEIAKDKLRQMGVSSPRVGESGTIPVGDRFMPEVLNSDIENTTRRSQDTLNNLPRRGDERVVNSMYRRPLCNILTCNTLKYLPIQCEKTVENYDDPEIAIDEAPTQVLSATAHLNPLNPRITGRIGIRDENLSEPGKITEKTVNKCSDEISEESRVVDSSAVLDTRSISDIIVSDVDEYLDTIDNSIEDLEPDVTVSSDVEFEKTGALETLTSILDVWTTGSMVADVTGNIRVQYEWRGTVNTETFSVDVRTRIPINNLNYDL